MVAGDILEHPRTAVSREHHFTMQKIMHLQYNAHMAAAARGTAQKSREVLGSGSYGCALKPEYDCVGAVDLERVLKAKQESFFFINIHY